MALMIRAPSGPTFIAKLVSTFTGHMVTSCNSLDHSVALLALSVVKAGLKIEDGILITFS